MDSDAAADAAPADQPFVPGQVVTVFRSRLEPGVGEEYGPMAAEMLELARTMLGFVDFAAFANDDERVSVITFADEASQRAWRDQADHRLAQRAGRDRFYASYSIQVSICARAHSFRAG